MEQKKKSGFKKALIIALALMLVLLAAWHLLFPLLGIAIAMTAAAWGIVFITVVLLSVGVLLFYILSGIGIAVICILGFIWFVVALVLFPFLFPLLLPLLILMLFIGFVRRKEN